MEVSHFRPQFTKGYDAMLSALRSLHDRHKNLFTVFAALACLCSLALCFQQGWGRSAASIDLPQYVVPAHLWLHSVNPYDVPRYAAEVHRLVPTANYWFYACPILPHGLLVMAPVASFSWPVANKIWWVVSFVSLVVALACLVSLFGKKWTTTEKLLFVALLAQSRLVQSVAYRGQVSLFLLAVTLCAVVCVRRERRMLAGFLLGIVCMKYTLAVPLVLYLLWKKEWRTLSWGAATVLIGSLMASWRLGLGNVMHTLPGSVLFFSGSMTKDMVNSNHIMSWLAIYVTTFGLHSRWMIVCNVLTLIAALTGFGFVFRRLQRSDQEDWFLAAAVMLGLTVVYHRVYDGVFVFIVAAAFWNLARQMRRRDRVRPVGLDFTLLAGLLGLFLFVFSIQNLTEALTEKMASHAFLVPFVPINAWLGLGLLALTFTAACRYAATTEPALTLSATSGTALHASRPRWMRLPDTFPFVRRTRSPRVKSK